MKKLLLTLLMSVILLGIQAQEKQRFSPEKFDEELQTFIIKEAKLTSQEAAKFFPVYKEMQLKQRALFDKQRQLDSNKPQDEASCMNAIRERDKLDLEMKRIQQTYHERFLEILPASKVYEIIKAESAFHRYMFKKFNRNKPNDKGNHNRGNRPHNKGNKNGNVSNINNAQN